VTAVIIDPVYFTIHVHVVIYKAFLSDSTNTYKTNNHLSPQIIEYKKRIMTYIYGIGNPGPGLGQAPKCGRVNQVLMASQSSSIT
jgi:hypothetical protein